MPAPFLACFAVVSAFYHLPPHVLPSIQLVEAGHAGVSRLNTDGSADLGVMQINSRWIPPLAQHTGQSESAVRQRLLHDACFNVAAAGAVMRIYLNEENGNLLRAIGDYHSHRPVRNQSYQLKVLEAAGRLFARSPGK